MTLAQGLAFALVGVTVLFFLWGRWRYDLRSEEHTSELQSH